MQAEPLVRKVMEYFPGAQIIAIRSAADAAPPPAATVITAETGEPENDEIGYADQIYTEDDL